MTASSFTSNAPETQVIFMTRRLFLSNHKTVMPYCFNAMLLLPVAAVVRLFFIRPELLSHHSQYACLAPTSRLEVTQFRFQPDYISLTARAALTNFISIQALLEPLPFLAFFAKCQQCQWMFCGINSLHNSDASHLKALSQCASTSQWRDSAMYALFFFFKYAPFTLSFKIWVAHSKVLQKSENRSK